MFYKSCVVVESRDHSDLNVVIFDENDVICKLFLSRTLSSLEIRVFLQQYFFLDICHISNFEVFNLLVKCNELFSPK
jgi:hypothetical protein